MSVLQLAGTVRCPASFPAVRRRHSILYLTSLYSGQKLNSFGPGQSFSGPAAFRPLNEVTRGDGGEARRGGRAELAKGALMPRVPSALTRSG
jgi:hypothetical protein